MRGFFCFFILLLVLVLSPLCGVIALAILLDSGLPVIFRQKRTGRGNRPFIIYKFRTMRHKAEEKQKEVVLLNEADGPAFKIRDDPRFTRVGKFLAHTGLDELPQLFNVLRGDMAIIGPRPLPVAEARKLKHWQRARHGIKPGIISSWVLDGYHKQSFDAWMKSDIAYIQKKSFLYDLRLAGRTLVFLTRLFFREIFPS
jgi:lipopolysaccharide/colanic/teichoic acid biosynthesis glycosyltransferase